MSQKFQVSKRVAGKLNELGVRVAAVLRHANLPDDLFKQPRILVSTEELFALWQGVAASSKDPVVGLKIGSEERADQYDPIAIASLCAKNLGDSLERMARYKQLTCPEKIEINRGSKECSVQFQWLLAKEEVPEILIDLCFAWVLTIARRGTGEAFSPSRVELQRPVRHRKELENFFGCPVRFRAARNALVFRASDVDRPFRTHNEELLAMISPALDAELNERVTQESLPDRVRRMVQARLAGQRPTVQDIAQELHMSSRTLQRRLMEEGASFQQVVEQARRDLARHYLAHSPLELTETAYLLGYEDANSFVRAFHGWEGVPPAQWRATFRQ